MKGILAALNRISLAIYGEEKRPSGILSKFAFSAEEILLLKTDLLIDFVENIQFALPCRFFGLAGGDRLYAVLCDRYGLLDGKSETLQAIGDRMTVSRERVRQLEQKAIVRLKPNGRTDLFAMLVFLAACKSLKLNPMSRMNGLENDDGSA